MPPLPPQDSRPRYQRRYSTRVGCCLLRELDKLCVLCDFFHRTVVCPRLAGLAARLGCSAARLAQAECGGAARSGVTLGYSEFGACAPQLRIIIVKEYCLDLSQLLICDKTWNFTPEFTVLERQGPM
ncbi:Proteasome subunit beta type-4 [Frankliniella fusca]|uniref:Proteasome subunit beta type-4 n=1 Tax=Frankliniella fusca TaxID=407009 RepID=A0AAE1LGV8_9NEOP|nr:Proteasome subunit beta type-4 [Frankliniella fusca]